MKFLAIVEQVSELLQRQRRISYRALKREFDLDDEEVEDLKAELIDARRLASDEDGKVLVWTGNSSLASRVQSLESEGQGRASAVQTLDPRPRTLDAAERRQLTVVFCDLVGSTTLSEQLDPEEYRVVVRAYHETCAEVISRYGGHTAQHLGDGLLVYFSYPVAHEDDAQRAVRAGLEIIAALQHFSSPLVAEAPVSPSPSQGEGSTSGASAGEGSISAQSSNSPHPSPLPKGARELRVRIGIHTGPVVIGEIGSSEKREILALGETPNIAARVQGIANPDEVVISAATQRLVEGLFECEERGQPELKGVTTPLTLYRVVKEGEAQSRFQVVVRKGLTPLIGREHEYGLLHERWLRVKDGAGQVVLLSGEPGIGKSRLVEALKETAEHEEARCFELRCSPYHQNSALSPVIEHLQRMLGFHSKDSPGEKLRKLEVGARRAVPLQPEAIPLLAALLSLPHPPDVPPLTLSPQKQKEKTHEALVAWLCAEAAEQAVVYTWEDLHWADPSTLELLTLFLAQAPTTRLLAALTFRPEFTPPWGAHSYLSQLTLSRLGRNHVETMVEKVTGGRALPKEIVQQIVSKTDGVPLFVEELTKMAVEAETDVEARHAVPLQMPIPTTLQDALMARLDRLGPAKEIAQMGATIGREFNYELLQAVFPLDAEILQQGLKHLVTAELVYQSGVPPQARYLFKHALVQDTAYQALLKSKRQQLHQQIGQVLAERFPETIETQPELLAHHYTEAGLIEQAIPYWQQAGQRAAAHSAHTEAISHLIKGIELLKTLPDTLVHAQQELTLQIAWGSSLIATKGYGAEEARAVYTRARDLCQRIGETPQLAPVMYGLWVFYLVRASLRYAYDLAKQMFQLAQRVQDQALLIHAYHALGVTEYWMGEIVSARENFERGIALYNPQQHHSLAFIYGQEPGVALFAQLSWVLWPLGYPDQALRRSDEATCLARESDHPYSLAYASAYAPILHWFRGESTESQGKAKTVRTLASNQGFVLWEAMATIWHGWALTETGQKEEGTAQIRNGLAAYQTIGIKLVRPRVAALLAEVYKKRGEIEEGLAVVFQGLEDANETEERVDESELHRLKGELLLAQEIKNQKSKGKNQKSKVETSPQSLPLNPQTEAEACFLKAIEISRQQQAKSLELRATMSLARLWQQQGRRHEARGMLSEVYNWFTEGFDTKDLQEAQALLAELSH